MSWKFGPPSRVSCVSRYENRRACSSGSSVKSMPGTTLPTQNATCSVSAKKLSGFRLSTRRPTGVTGTSSSGMIFVGSSRSMSSNANSLSSGTSCSPSSYSGKTPASIASQRSRRLKSGSRPEISWASSNTSECVPSSGVQWNFTNVACPAELTRRNVWTPKPCIVR
jgi:hypothetical protein